MIQNPYLPLLILLCFASIVKYPRIMPYLMWSFSPNQKAHWWPMKWSLIWEYFYLFYFMLCFHGFFFVVATFFILGSCSMHGLWEKGFGSSCKLLQGYMFSRIRCHQRTELIRRAFRCFNNFGPHQCYFWRHPIGWEWGFTMRFQRGSIDSMTPFKICWCPICV